jgi:hypothetical protein
MSAQLMRRQRPGGVAQRSCPAPAEVYGCGTELHHAKEPGTRERALQRRRPKLRHEGHADQSRSARLGAAAPLPQGP